MNVTLNNLLAHSEPLQNLKKNGIYQDSQVKQQSDDAADADVVPPAPPAADPAQSDAAASDLVPAVADASDDLVDVSTQCLTPPHSPSCPCLEKESDSGVESADDC